MTRRGRLFELPTSAPLTTATGGSAWPHLPTPTVADAYRGPDYAKRGRPGSGGDDLTTAICRLFPRDKAEKLFKTPTANLANNGSAQHPDKRKAGGHGPTLEDEVCFLLNVGPDDERPDDGPHSPAEWWGDFARAVYRWECIRGTAAPIPIVRGPRGGLKLAPKFAEWLMGLEPGWVTDVPGLSHREQIGRIGNGVVPHQAFYAFRWLMQHETHTEESNGQDTPH
ncbi:DNA (cytosine-5-)-methyltransferase [Streptomyces uncialis]|uniref:DNA (cytosine-5-)-methyltransferase n=1 Tax=Streptomyces uncialis TaxID=1048205 RepID=UPI00381A340E